jgi:hypothetical protein
MAPSSRDRISVDLRGLKPTLVARAMADGVSPSALVRDALATALGETGGLDLQSSGQRDPGDPGARVRLYLRMGSTEAAATLAAARQAGLNPGAYVAGLVAGVPVLRDGGQHAHHRAALVVSSAELASLSRSIHHLTALLRQGDVRAAHEYRVMLDTLAGDVRGHLALASGVLADLGPRRHPPRASLRTTPAMPGESHASHPEH